MPHNCWLNGSTSEILLKKCQSCSSGTWRLSYLFVKGPLTFTSQTRAWCSIEKYRSDKGSYEQHYTVHIFKSVILETSIENYRTVVARKCPHIRWLVLKIGSETLKAVTLRKIINISATFLFQKIFANSRKGTSRQLDCMLYVAICQDLSQLLTRYSYFQSNSQRYRYGYFTCYSYWTHVDSV